MRDTGVVSDDNRKIRHSAFENKSASGIDARDGTDDSSFTSIYR